MNLTYHSIHGAIQESLHVFIEAGFKRSGPSGSLNILEMGFGTGLNALLTLLEADKLGRPVHYTAIELYPLNPEEIYQLNYCTRLNRDHHQMIFEKFHKCEWEKDHMITPFFTFYKTNTDPPGFSANRLFDLIYFDAFAPAAQPELWTKQIFASLYKMMRPGGILVTYCSKGEVRRSMQSAGFNIEKVPGPPGKREMLRAYKSQES